MNFKKYTTLKEIPLLGLGLRSPPYYIALGPGNVKIEPYLTIPQGENLPPLFGWRIFINLDAKASLISNGTFTLPIQKRKGNITDFYQLYLDNRLMTVQTNERGEQSTFHPVLYQILEYAQRNCKNTNYTISIEKIKELRDKEFDSGEKIKGFSYTILEVELLDRFPIPISHGGGYLNPQEADLLSFDDISDIKLKIPSLSREKKEKINELLAGMFLDDDYNNEKGRSTAELLKISSSIGDYIEGRGTLYSGMVLYGPPGSGKTHLIEKSLIRIYELLGFGVHKVEAARVFSSPYVGGLARNVANMVFGPAIQIVKNRKVPCFIFIDEATDLLRNTSNEGDSGWRRQGIEAMKSFINRSKYPGIVVCLATNLERNEFDDALTRTGRLEKIYIGLPNYERCLELWQYINRTYFEARFKKEQLDELSKICQDKISVATIKETCERNPQWSEDYDDFKRRFFERAKSDLDDEYQRGINNLNKAVQGGILVREESERRSKELDYNYQNKIHQINSLLDPNHPTTMNIIGKVLSSVFGSKERRIEDVYDNFYKLVQNWLQYTTSDNNGNSNNPWFESRSISLMKRAMKFAGYLNENLEDKFSSLKEQIFFISSIFEKICEIPSNPNNAPSLTRNDIISLNRMIEQLPKSLNDSEQESNK